MLNKVIKFISKYNNNWVGLTITLIAACLVMSPLLIQGNPRGTDLTQHLQFASTYQDAILSGDFFPGWAATDNYGLGSIGIRFYPPLAYYLLAVSHMIVGNWYDAFWTNAFFWMIIGCVGMYFWAKEWLSPIEAAFVAVCYAFAPYHRFQMYQLILFAEFAAAGILPFCFLTITKVIRRGKPIDIILFGIFLALLILSHIPTTILGLIGLGVYSLSLMNWKDYRKVFANLAMGGGLGLAASSFHWLRIVTEMNWVKHSAEYYTVEFYDYSKNLYPMSQYLIQGMPPLDSAIILFMICLIPLAVYLLVNFKTKQKDAEEIKFVWALTITGIVCAFLMTSPSLFVWEHLSFLQKIQFPWRLLAVSAVVASMGLIFSMSRLLTLAQSIKPLLFYLPVLLFLPVFSYYFAVTIKSYPVADRQLFAADINGLKEMRGCECWRPNWAEPAAFDEKEKVSADGRNVIINSWESESREFQISPGTGQNISIATFYYPYWKATVNNQPVEITPTDTGLISFSIPSEDSQVRLYFAEPLFLTVSLYLSGLVWIFFLTFLLLYPFRRRTVKTP